MLTVLIPPVPVYRSTTATARGGQAVLSLPLRKLSCNMQPASLPDVAQDWSAEHYQRHSFVPELGRDLLGLLQARPGERVLDVGCGDGVLTAQLQAAGVEVVGLDASADLLAAAHDKGVKTVQLDAHKLSEAAASLGKFDGVLSNAALHWMADLPTVLAGISKVLAPGGRFVAEMGGYGNVASVFAPLREALAPRGIDVDAVSPWVSPTVEQATSMLESCGFHIQMMDLFPRPTPLPHGFQAWLQTFANAFLDRLPSEADRAEVLQQVTSAWEAVPSNSSQALTPTQGQQWTLDYVRLRFVAVKPQ